MAEFDESKHPRNADGTFKSKNGASGNERLRFGLSFFKSKRNNDANKSIITKEIAVDNIPKEITGFEGGRENTPHHQEHMKELGYKDEKQYQKGAIEFWEKGNGKTYFSEYTQRYYKYDSKTERLLVVDNNATLKTFFKYGNKKFIRKIRQDKLYEI